MVSEATINRYRALIQRISFERAQAIAEIPNSEWRAIKEELRAIGLNPSSKASVLAQKRLLTVVVHEIQQEQPTRAEIREIAETAWAEELIRLREENERLRAENRENAERIREQQELIDQMQEELQAMREEIERVRQAQQPQQPIGYDEELEGLEEEPSENTDIVNVPTFTDTRVEQHRVGSNTIIVARRNDDRIDQIYNDIEQDLDSAGKIGIKLHFKDQNGSEFTQWTEYTEFDLEEIERDIETNRNKYGSSSFGGISVWAIH